MFLSIIIPVYNTEKYLDECLRSLLEQDIPKTDYEIICVNDGSTDGSLDVLREYEAENPNVTIIDKENGGVAAARNVGFNRAQGDYVWFVDSDDYIMANSIGMLMKTIKESDCDRLIVGQSVFTDCVVQSESGGIPHREIHNNGPWHDSVVSRSLLRRDFLIRHNLRFHYPELTYGEDALYVYEMKRHNPRCVEVSENVYYYRNHPESAVTGTTPEAEKRRLMSSIREAQILKQYYESGGVIPSETANRFMSFLWGSLYRLVQLPRKEAAHYMQQLKESGLYPYKRPKECTITKSYQTARTDWIGRMFDRIYINMSTRTGFYAMRGWILLSRFKRSVFDR